MTKMFDKVSEDFMNTIRSVLSEKKLDPVNPDELKGTHAQRKDKDIDNDGEVDSTDRYLHARRKAIHKAMKEEDEDMPFKGPYRKAGEVRKDQYGNTIKNVAKHLAKKAMADKAASMKEAIDQLDEISAELKSRYKKGAQRSMDQAQDFKAELDYEGEPKGSRVRKDVNRIIKNRKMGMKRANEEAEQIDELSKKTLGSYITKREPQADTMHDKAMKSGDTKDWKKANSMLGGVTRAKDKWGNNKKYVKVGSQNEEAEQIDELSKKTLGSYVSKASKSAAGLMAGAAASGVGGTPSSYGKQMGRDALRRLKGIDKAASKLAKEEIELTAEEIEMIEARMAGVADDALPGNQHMCATKIFHKEWLEGTPVPTMHADPDEDGLIEWYDVMFDHGIERVMTEDVEVISEKMHGHKRMKEAVEELEEMSSKMKMKLGLYGKKKKMKEEADEDEDEEAQDDKLSMAIKKKLSDEGGAAAFKPLKDAAMKMGVKLTPQMLKNMPGVEQHSDGDYILDESAKIAAHLIKRYGDNVRKSHVHSAANDFGVDASKLAKAVRTKLNKTTLDEARGRPKKAGQTDFTINPRTKEKLMHDNPEHMKKIKDLQRTGVLERPNKEAGQHIMNQLQKAKLSMRGGETVNFNYGAPKHVTGEQAAKLLTKYAGMKPSEKEDFQQKISHSHEHMMKHV